MIPTIPGNLFSWNGREGTVEESDLRRFGDLNRGFYVKSHKTNTSLLFLYDSLQRCNDGDIMYWVFVSPAQDIVIRIYND